MTKNNSQLFKYKAVIVGKTTGAINNINSSEKDTKIIVPLKYLSNSWGSLKSINQLQNSS